MKYGLFITILFVACAEKVQHTDSIFGRQINFEKSGLRESVDSITYTFNHGISFNINRDSVDELFQIIKTLDKFDSSLYHLYIDTCDKTTARTWKCKTSKCVATRLVKRDYDWRQGDLTVHLTEYEMFRLEKPKYISLKTINNKELHALVVQDRMLDVLKEDVIVDIDEGFIELDQQKNKCVDSVSVKKEEKVLRGN